MTDLDRLDPDRVVLAGEYSLRLLEHEQLAHAKRLMLSDPDFAAMVEWWDHRINDLNWRFVDVPPPSGMWRAIQLRLSEQDNSHVANRPHEKIADKSWGRIAAGLVGFVLGSILMFALIPDDEAPGPIVADAPEMPTPVAPQLVANFGDGAGGLEITTRLDPDSNRLSVLVAGAPEAILGPDRAPELWVVPDGGAPLSLGLLPYDGLITLELDSQTAGLFQSGALIAVTYEDRASAPHTAPTTDIVAAGPLVEI